MNNIRQIMHCEQLIERAGVCLNMWCPDCPATKTEESGCWDPNISEKVPSELVVTKAKEFLVEHQ